MLSFANGLNHDLQSEGTSRSRYGLGDMNGARRVLEGGVSPFRSKKVRLKIVGAAPPALTLFPKSTSSIPRAIPDSNSLSNQSKTGTTASPSLFPPSAFHHRPFRLTPGRRMHAEQKEGLITCPRGTSHNTPGY
jgi:hypothetical protein